MIPVTKPTLPSLSTFTATLRHTWQTGILTHHGPLVQEFERKISKIANDANVVATVNGTIAIQLALRSLPRKGEIIVPSFTWIATVSAIEYEGFKPVFCDICPETFNIDPTKIGSLINDNTVGVIPVHVFGQPADIKAIEKIALDNGIDVIYDAAHAFGSRYNNRSVLAIKSMSCVSFHATKIINSGEGGGIFTSSNKKIPKLNRLRFFGYDDEKNLVDEGTNAKMTEIHAALGLCNLELFDEVLEGRRLINERYRALLSNIDELSFQKVKTKETNFSYFPLVFRSKNKMLATLKKLTKKNILSRRYFYPSLSTLPRFRQSNPCTPISDDLSQRILCLPCFHGMSRTDQELVAKTIVT